MQWDVGATLMTNAKQTKQRKKFFRFFYFYRHQMNIQVRDTVTRKSLLYHIVSRWTKNPNLVKVEASLAHLDLVKVPGVAPWPWQFAPRAEGPWPRCQDGL